jgi:hypothetical protein
VHNVGFPHGHTEKMFETSGKNDSFKEDLDMEVATDFRVVVDFAEVPHVEAVLVEGLRDALGVCEVG